jgi:hypothetical protein
MALVDGLDGYLAASTLNLAASGESNARAASRILGILVVLFAFGLGGAELMGTRSINSRCRSGWHCSRS